MANFNQESRMKIANFDFAKGENKENAPMCVNSLVTRLQQAMGNPTLQAEVIQQLRAYGIIPPLPQERGLMEPLNEVSTRRLFPIREEGPKE